MYLLETDNLILNVQISQHQLDPILSNLDPASNIFCYNYFNYWLHNCKWMVPSFAAVTLLKAALKYHKQDQILFPVMWVIHTYKLSRHPIPHNLLQYTIAFPNYSSLPTLPTGDLHYTSFSRLDATNQQFQLQLAASCLPGTTMRRQLAPRVQWPTQYIDHAFHTLRLSTSESLYYMGSLPLSQSNVHWIHIYTHWQLIPYQPVSVCYWEAHHYQNQIYDYRLIYPTSLEYCYIDW